MRKRIPGYITQVESDQFGMTVRVQRTTGDSKLGYPASGDPVPEGQMGDGDNFQNDVKFRNVIPPGDIGTRETNDLDILTLHQHLDTKPFEADETRPQELHNAPTAQKVVRGTPTPFYGYATFTPRRAPMPMNSSDDVCLPYRANLHAADPLMHDKSVNASVMWNRVANEMPGPDPYRKDLYGDNVDGVLHNENENPVTTAAREASMYTGESGARQTRSILMEGKDPEQAAKYLQKETSDLQRRAGYIASKKK